MQKEWKSSLTQPNRIQREIYYELFDEFVTISHTSRFRFSLFSFFQFLKNEKMKCEVNDVRLIEILLAHNKFKF